MHEKRYLILPAEGTRLSDATSPAGPMAKKLLVTLQSEGSGLPK